MICTVNISKLKAGLHYRSVEAQQSRTYWVEVTGFTTDQEIHEYLNKVLKKFRSRQWGSGEEINIPNR